MTISDQHKKIVEHDQRLLDLEKRSNRLRAYIRCRNGDSRAGRATDLLIAIEDEIHSRPATTVVGVAVKARQLQDWSHGIELGPDLFDPLLTDLRKIVGSNTQV